MADKILRAPGEVLGLEGNYVAGPGTYIWKSRVYSSLLGYQIQHPPVPGTPDQSQMHYMRDCSRMQRSALEVQRKQQPPAIPQPGATVTAKVTKVTPRVALADILVVGAQTVNQKFSGIVKQQDVRATEIDKVDMYESFRPGDVIQAQVLSLGDSRSYYLSTAKDEFGVVYAKSKSSGESMVAVSWQEMMCPSTEQKEFRKVAKVVST